MKTKEELKLYFENGDIPRQEDFWAWQDSYWHKDEKLDKTALGLTSYNELTYSPTDNTEIIGLDSVIIFPEGIKVIGGFQFSLTLQNRISKIKFPNSLERIRSRAFQIQHIKGSLKIPGNCKVIESFAFNSVNTHLSELILENGIETIEESAFQLPSSFDLTSLDIPDSVKFVGKNAFAIPSLKSVIIPEDLDISNAGIPGTAIIIARAKESIPIP
ncbi:leucine-rich repeat domain-containing protein [Chryseobacterium sp. c4a]|uniref:leucine-rich repeat domain-containing protein n=1 Tax=Chryseobacterium sp. c4a TaxID=1573582 RepID=UPI00135C4C63|nr:leucine-rich repeat domain-containing protein [Chryseobacterium sp. c4a]